MHEIDSAKWSEEDGICRASPGRAKKIVWGIEKEAGEKFLAPIYRDLLHWLDNWILTPFNFPWLL